MILTLDIGNTRAKITIFRQEEIVHHATVAHSDVVKELNRLVATNANIERVNWCSVGREIAELDAALAALPCSTRRLTASTVPSGIRVEYATPQTLGADRLAAVMGARSLRPQQSLLVIDAGTCLTFDVILKDGRYLGGNISPGLEMRLKAMHEQTARLPQIEVAGEQPRIGNTTETAMRSGAVWGISYEIEGYIRALTSQYGEICVFLTGGNQFDFHISTESCIFADDFLVARGLRVL